MKALYIVRILLVIFILGIVVFFIFKLYRGIADPFGNLTPIHVKTIETKNYIIDWYKLDGFAPDDYPQSYIVKHSKEKWWIKKEIDTICIAHNLYGIASHGDDTLLLQFKPLSISEDSPLLIKRASGKLIITTDFTTVPKVSY